MPSPRSSNQSSVKASSQPSHQSSSKSSGRPASQTSSGNSLSTNTNPPTRYRIVKDGWGGRPNFQASYGLGMDPDSIAEGNKILDALIDHEKMTEDEK